jgi:heme/copper-type cytochrome/quinol oxidase subunit 3
VLKKRLPGDLAMWFFILAELTVFAILFIGFAVADQLNPVMFIEGKAAGHKTTKHWSLMFWKNSQHCTVVINV